MILSVLIRNMNGCNADQNFNELAKFQRISLSLSILFELNIEVGGFKIILNILLNIWTDNLNK